MFTFKIVDYSAKEGWDCWNKKCRNKPSPVDRTDVSDVDRTDRLLRQSTLCPTNCAAGSAVPGRGTAGLNIVHSLGCVSKTWVLLLQGTMGYLATGAPRRWATTPLFWGEPQPHYFECGINVFYHAPNVCMLPRSKLAYFVVEFLCVLTHVIKDLCGCQCCYISSWITHAITR